MDNHGNTSRNGKGMEPKKGYNYKNFAKNYDLINWGHKNLKNKYKKEKK